MYNYNPNDTTITIDGVYMTGLGEDMITFAFQEERFSPVVGAQGDVIVNETNNKLADMTLSVFPYSPQYKMCIEYARNGTVFPIWGINKSIGERFGGTKARIKNVPEISYGTELEAREFEITVFDGVVEPA